MKNIQLLILTGFLLVNLIHAQTFTIIGLPDTQKYTKEEDGGVKEMFYAQTQWIADNVESENIVFVSHFGDITDDGSNPGAMIQWEYADTAMSTLEQSDYSVDGIPYAVLPGNHDKYGGTANYNNFFGVDRFDGRWYYGEGFQGNENNYCLFSAGGMDFILISLEFNPPTLALNWADGILSTYSERRAIITAHSILSTDGEFTPPGNASSEGNGIGVYNMARNHANVFLMLCGHNHGETYRSDTYYGNTIHSVLADYQSYTNGGDGYLRIMEFDPANDVINFKTYSPWLNQWSTTGASQFSLPYEMDGGAIINNPPQIENQSFSIEENSENGQSVGTVLAMDPDAGQVLSYAILSGNTNDAFQIENTSGQITVNNSQALDFETNPSFGLMVKVTDNGEVPLSAQATITIDLTDLNETPVISDQEFDVDENSANNTIVGTVEADDPDNGQTLTYSITGGNTGNAFGIGSATGLLTVNNASMLDFETITQFNLTVEVQDDGSGNLSSAASITIYLNDINEYPVVSADEFIVLESIGDNMFVGEIIAEDPDNSQTLTFSIIDGNTDNAFAIGSSSGIMTVNNSAAIDFESIPAFNLTVEAEDNGPGNLTASAQIIIYIEDVNEDPVMYDQTFAVDENTPTSTVVGQIEAEDPDNGQSLSYAIISGNSSNAFELDPVSGVLIVDNNAVLDFENTSVFNLVVEVEDNGPGSLSDSAMITININDLNEAPVIEDQSFTVIENTANGSLIGAVDADDPDAGQSVSFSILSGNLNDAFQLDLNTGELTVLNSDALNFEANSEFILLVQVVENTTAAMTAEAKITVAVLDINEPPQIEDQFFTLEELSPNGTAVGTVVADDPDTGQNLTYSILSGNVDEAFTLDPNTGLLSVNNSEALDFQINPEIALEIEVADNASDPLSSNAIVTVQLTQVFVGMEALQNEKLGFSLSPNPAASKTVLHVKNLDSHQKKLQYVIYNLHGELIQNFRTEVNSPDISEAIDLTNFDPGTYIVKIYNGNSAVVGKLVKL